MWVVSHVHREELDFYYELFARDGISNGRGEGVQYSKEVAH